MTTIIAISNNKGGVAKTTTCLSLGACLAELGYATLVIDLDPQADLTLAAGFDAEALAWSIADLLSPMDPDTVPERDVVICPTAVERLAILPADPRLANVGRQLYDWDGYEWRLLRLLRPWLEAYAYILLDCPPSLGSLTLMALTTARYVIIPVQCEYYAARRLGRLLDVVGIVRSRTNADLVPHLLATMYDQRTRIGRGVLEQLKLNFEGQLFDTVIGVDTRLRECPAVGEPIILYAPQTRARQHYRELAREVQAKFEPTGV